MNIKERIELVSQEIQNTIEDLNNAYEAMESSENSLVFLRGRLEELRQIEKAVINKEETT